MLTWNIFMIIMSVTSLTLVNVNSADPEYPDTPRPSRGRGRGRRGRSSANVDPSGPSRSRRGREPRLGDAYIYNPVDRQTNVWRYNLHNEFENPGSFEFNCYAQIKLFCDTDYNRVLPYHCLKNAILLYKNNLKIVRDGSRKNLSRGVFNYYSNMPVISGSFRLPRDHCNFEANRWIITVEDYNVIRHDRNEKNQRIQNYVNECMNDLNAYRIRVVDPGFAHSQSINTAASESRQNIIRFALLNISLIDLGNPSFERQYLNIIADTCEPAPTAVNPYDFCADPANNPNHPSYQPGLEVGQSSYNVDD